MKYFLLGSILLSLISTVWSETRDCSISCSTDTNYDSGCWGYGYTTCWECNGILDDLCIADCGWFYVTDCNSCQCGGVSTAGICVIIFSILFCCLCCGCIGRSTRRRRYARNPEMTQPLRSAQPVAAVGVVTTTNTPGIVLLILIY